MRRKIAGSLQFRLVPRQLLAGRPQLVGPFLQRSPGRGPVVLQLLAHRRDLGRELTRGPIARLLRLRQLLAQPRQLTATGLDAIFRLLFRLRRRARPILRPLDLGRGPLGMGLGSPSLRRQIAQQRLVLRLQLRDRRRLLLDHHRRAL
ncbi:MAG: hypothetical protein E6J88_04285, partial [Deltaproteobacteria bacterium]